MNSTENPDVSDVCLDCGKPIPALPKTDALCVSCRYQPTIKPTDSGISEDEIALGKLFAPSPELDDEILSECDSDKISAAQLAVIIKNTRLQTITNLFQLLHTDATMLHACRRFAVLSFQLGFSGCSTHQQAAAQLKISPGRFSQILSDLPEEFRSIKRLKSRSAKARPSCRGSQTSAQIEDIRKYESS